MLAVSCQKNAWLEVGPVEYVGYHTTLGQLLRLDATYQNIQHQA